MPSSQPRTPPRSPPGSRPSSRPSSPPSSRPTSARDPTAYLNNITRVICRVRPPDEEKREDNHIKCEAHVGGYLEVSKPQREESRFGVVLGPSCTQHEVYLSCGVPMVESALRGRDSLLFAYGQTGAGKTFSMYGAEGGKNPSKLDGVVPATVSELFRRTIGQEKDSAGAVKFALSATLVEIQGSNIFDLLAEPDRSGNQPLVKVLGSSLLGAKIERIYSSRALTHTIERGMATCAPRATEPLSLARGPAPLPRASLPCGRVSPCSL